MTRSLVGVFLRPTPYVVLFLILDMLAIMAPPPPPGYDLILIVDPDGGIVIVCIQDDATQ